jgi:hypothetical protein
MSWSARKHGGRRAADTATSPSVRFTRGGLPVAGTPGRNGRRGTVRRTPR